MRKSLFKKGLVVGIIVLLIGLGVVPSTRRVLSNETSFGGILEENNEEVVSVLVYLKDQVDLDKITTHMDEQRASLQLRHETVVVELQNTASESQTEIVEYLNDLKSQDLVKDFKCYWVGNIIRVDTYQYIVDEIAKRDDVEEVYPNYGIELIEPTYESFESEPGYKNDVENGLEAIRAPEVWDLGITGEGVLVATIDTGVDGNHPALASRWAGVADPRYEGHPEWAWLDSSGGQNDFPFDYGNHGTHTMGTVCGGAPGDQIGVAPGALWMSAGWAYSDVPHFVSDIIESFEWMIDPDGDPTTNWDVPDVCSNSWGLSDSFGVPDCDETFWTYLDACEAAGTVIIFIAGNEGSQGLRRPADRATDDYRCFAVAAVDANDPDWPIADFSSRGPTYCNPNGDEAIKPDIAAPGVSVRSSVPGGGYTTYSGTSMAAPHINGVVALMREANPNIGVEEIKEIIFQTAYDLGDPGEDNDYGWGMVDAYEAVLHTSQSPETPSVPEGPEEWIQNAEATFSTSATEPEGEDVYYMFDWGDGNFSEWVGPYASGETGEASHNWTELGEYEIKAIAKDINNIPSNWSEPAILSIVENEKPSKVAIDGTKYGFGGVEYEFTFVSTDADGHDLYYRVNWDDGHETGYIGPYSSGETITLSHSWKNKGDYWIKSWAKDTMGDESNQASHKLVILTNKVKTAQIYRFLERFPILTRLLYLING